MVTAKSVTQEDELKSGDRLPKRPDYGFGIHRGLLAIHLGPSLDFVALEAVGFIIGNPQVTVKSVQQINDAFHDLFSVIPRNNERNFPPDDRRTPEPVVTWKKR